MKRLLIIIFLLKSACSFSAQEAITILSEKIWTTGEIKAHFIDRKKHPAVLQAGAFSNLYHVEMYEGIQTKVTSGHEYNVLNTEGYTLLGTFEAKFCYNGNNCVYAEREVRVVNYTTAHETVYLNFVIEGLKVGAYPMHAETRLILDGKFTIIM